VAATVTAPDGRVRIRKSYFRFRFSEYLFVVLLDSLREYELSLRACFQSGISLIGIKLSDTRKITRRRKTRIGFRW